MSTTEVRTDWREFRFTPGYRRELLVGMAEFLNGFAMAELMHIYARQIENGQWKLTTREDTTAELFRIGAEAVDILKGSLGIDADRFSLSMVTPFTWGNPHPRHVYADILARSGAGAEPGMWQTKGWITNFKRHNRFRGRVDLIREMYAPDAEAAAPGTDAAIRERLGFVLSPQGRANARRTLDIWHFDTPRGSEYRAMLGNADLMAAFRRANGL